MSESTESTPTVPVRLVSLGTGRSVDVPDGTTVGELREMANISPDLELRFNGERVTDENAGQTLRRGDTVTAAAPSVKHGLRA